eukprot:SAG31_NODE_893_length_11177_cov_10.241806_7_plen_115_part_00
MKQSEYRFSGVVPVTPAHATCVASYTAELINAWSFMKRIVIPSPVSAKLVAEGRLPHEALSVPEQPLPMPRATRLIEDSRPCASRTALLSRIWFARVGISVVDTSIHKEATCSA